MSIALLVDPVVGDEAMRVRDVGSRRMRIHVACMSVVLSSFQVDAGMIIFVSGHDAALSLWWNRGDACLESYRVDRPVAMLGDTVMKTLQLLLRAHRKAIRVRHDVEYDQTNRQSTLARNERRTMCCGG